MLNKLHGQPDSYDKKCVQPYPTSQFTTDIATTDPSTSLARHSEPAPTASSEKQSHPKENAPSRSS